MTKLYSSPFRVYLILGALAAVGIVAGLNLPVSLFPNSSKPQVEIDINSYGGKTAEEFLNFFGQTLEKQLSAISTDRAETDIVEAHYYPQHAEYQVFFKWGNDPTSAKNEVQNVVNSLSSLLSEDSRRSVDVWLNARSTGFLGIAFFSRTRGLDEVYKLLEPTLMPKVALIKEAGRAILFNPERKEIRIQMIPDAMASLQLFPKDIEQAVGLGIGSQLGGSVTVGTRDLNIEMPRRAVAVDDFPKIVVRAPSGQLVHLGDVARIDLAPSQLNSGVFKTSGAPSLFLFATPRPGGNIKKMSDEILATVKETMPQLPKDIQYKVAVDPSEFIRAAVNNVLREVFVGSMLAVGILFIFIGSLRNVVTAAIEIPLSMVLAFILMKISGMNLNLVSLGGLALAAGMNVDASVVVMENIIRHFEASPGPHDYKTRLQILVKAVDEVRFPVIASTIASVVVFLPLAFTSALSYAILGDLAKTVVFSHAFSAVVALILVPTVRLQLMSTGKEREIHSPIEPLIRKLENGYSKALGIFIGRPLFKWGAYAGLGIALCALALFVLPGLPKEIIGLPDTDWMTLSLSTEGNTLVKQMEAELEPMEGDLLRKLGSKARYTFTEIWDPNNGFIFVRIADKRDMLEVWKMMDKLFTNRPLWRFNVRPWNPSELPIPDPPDMRIAVRGGQTTYQRADVARSVLEALEEKKVFPRLSTEPSAEKKFGILLEPHWEQWEALGKTSAKFGPQDLADLARVSTQGRRIAFVPLDDILTDVVVQFPRLSVKSTEDVEALPVGVDSKIVPLKSLADVKVKPVTPIIFRSNQRELFWVDGKQNKEDAYKAPASLAKAHQIVADWEKKRAGTASANQLGPSVTFEPPDKDLPEALHQLTIALGLSIFLIFMTLLIQFGNIVETFLVMVSVPLGFIGVLISLWVFRSSLSLNSVLGVILLNGIAVANSIILVDFINRLIKEGRTPKEAALEAARKRLRPILITSLTTVLGMMPIALGLGEGGRILQPLGIAVSGGLWVSMALTLFLVPALQVSYLDWRLAHPAFFRNIIRRRLAPFLDRAKTAKPVKT